MGCELAQQVLLSDFVCYRTMQVLMGVGGGEEGLSELSCMCHMTCVSYDFSQGHIPHGKNKWQCQVEIKFLCITLGPRPYGA